MSVVEDDDLLSYLTRSDSESCQILLPNCLWNLVLRLPIRVEGFVLQDEIVQKILVPKIL